MAAWSKPGSGRSVTTSSAHSSPWASEIATRTGRGATAAAVTIVCCSSTDRKFLPPELLGIRPLQSVDQPFAQRWAVLVHVQRKVNRSSEVAAGISEIVSRASVHDDVNGMAFLDEEGDGVGELELAACAGFDPPQRIEDRAVEEIATCGGERGRRILDGRF